MSTDNVIVPIDAGRLDNVERSTQQYLTGFGEKICAQLTMWLVVGGPRPLLVDVGAGSPEIVANHQNGRVLDQDRDPRDALAELGVEPEDIGTVVLTHLHWDHCQGFEMAAFPEAEVVVQRREVQYAAAPYPPHAGLFNRAVLRRLEDGAPGYPRMRVVDGDVQLAPGVRVVATPGHTPGMAAVLVDTADGTYAIASDNVPLRSSWTGPTPDRWIPNGIHVGLDDCYASLTRLAAEATHVLPSHDRDVFDHDRYPPNAPLPESP